MNAKQMILSQLKSNQSASGLLFFRMSFGLLGLIAMSRLIFSGWLDDFLLKPQYTFKHQLLWFLEVPSAFWLYTIAVLTLFSCILIIIGHYYRVAVIAFFLGFSAIHMMDISNYLNHYYLISLLAFLMFFLPLGRLQQEQVNGYHYLILRFQIAILYFYAGVAKLNSDWLFYAQPLKIWLKARVSYPWIGWLFEYDIIPYLMSWAGCLYDLSIVFWLSWSISRKYAYLTVIFFHLMTSQLFEIGMFPWIMISLTTIYFHPQWFETTQQRLKPYLWWIQGFDTREKELIFQVKGLNKIRSTLFVIYAFIQIMMPLRTFVYGGNVLWHEQGMRFSWRVMLREKNGSLVYFAQDRAKAYPKRVEINPKDYLTWRQTVELSAQPDMIVSFAHYLAKELKKRE